ncbi:hypothetical protein HETIRDRAFT_459587 [Heterobasidion irregulare TC 32-1]|uniref:DUF6533 domain-containing protein n=1 Tax=Heterobasidion irregulare (strain TC 32-1) TaxID=747525 RepID=W4K768_HETIT|nr:uncharacterized protein HETIRDRAFT_459587 [Heterobasidion irregulare TC 32-1]ETW81185.1 hypothetical protein HETIRDRAFT_459587 [Heterobasidion irregulare TC 32-1]
MDVRGAATEPTANLDQGCCAEGCTTAAHLLRPTDDSRRFARTYIVRTGQSIDTETEVGSGRLSPEKGLGLAHKTALSPLAPSHKVVWPTRSSGRMNKAAEAHAFGAQLVDRSAIASLAFLVWDIIITLGDEVDTIWPKRNTNWTKWLFLFVRYFAVATQIAELFVGTEIAAALPYTMRSCVAWYIFQEVATQLLITSVEVILMVRVHAMYERNRTITLVLLVLFVAEIVAMLATLVLVIPDVQFDDICVVTHTPTTLIFFALAFILFETLLFGLTLFKFVQAVRTGWGHTPVMALLARDGTWAFALIFAVLCINAGFYLGKNSSIGAVAYTWILSIESFAGYRLILNMQRLDGPSEADTRQSTEIQFTTGFRAARGSVSGLSSGDDSYARELGLGLGLGRGRERGREGGRAAGVWRYHSRAQGRSLGISWAKPTLSEEEEDEGLWYEMTVAGSGESPSKLGSSSGNESASGSGSGGTNTSGSGNRGTRSGGSVGLGTTRTVEEAEMEDTLVGTASGSGSGSQMMPGRGRRGGVDAEVQEMERSTAIQLVLKLAATRDRTVYRPFTVTLFPCDTTGEGVQIDLLGTEKSLLAHICRSPKRA